MKCLTSGPTLAVVAMVLTLFPIAPRVAAQAVTGAILGSVRDSSGAVVVNVKVTAKSMETGAVRTASTDGAGTYQILSVPAGQYEVSTSLSGFKTDVRTGINVTVGATVTVNFTLSVGGVEEKVEVSGEAAQVDVTTATMSALVNDRTIRELPLNGRDWLQLTLLQPGAVFAAGQQQSDTARAQRGNGLAISISGGRSTENAFRIDGLVVNDYANNGPGSSLRVNLGVDAIREFSVLTNSYSAEYGRGSGGIVNAITKSGTNEIHGTAFYFHRNSALDARNFFDKAKPPFRRHQFGGSIGGPIKRDKTFFFANVEALREFLSLSVVSDTFAPNVHNGVLTSGTVTVDPRVKPYLDLFPLPNGAITGDTGKFVFGGGRIGNEDYVTGKIDHNVSSKTTLNGSYTFDNARLTTPDSYNQRTVSSPSRRQNFILTLQHTFSPTLINTTRSGFSRTYAANLLGVQTTVPTLADPSLGFVPGRNVGNFSIPGITSITGVGADGSNIFGYTAPQVADDLSWLKGKHSFRFGFSVERIIDNMDAKDTPNGSWTFGSIRDFLIVRPTRFTADFVGTDTQRAMRNTVIGSYFQDDIRVLRNLTLNLGVRYEMSTVVTEAHGKMANLRNLTDAAPTIGEPYYKNPTLRNFAPRVGVAWDPFGDGKTSVRSGFGIFDIVPLPYLFINRMPRSAPFFLAGFLSNPPASSFPNQVFGLLGPSTLRGAYVEFNPKRPYKMQWNLNVQRQITQNLAVMAGYVGASGVHLPQSTEDIDQVPPSLVTRSPDGHYLFPATGTIQRINPNFGRIAATRWIGHSSYHSMQLNVSQRLSRGFSIQGAYTWSKSIDDGSNTWSDAESSNTTGSPWPFDPRLNRGPADFDIPHNLVINSVWQLPSPKSLTGLPGFVLSGWEVAGIYQIRNGVPFSVKIPVDRARTGNSVVGLTTGAQRPDFVPGPGCTTNAINPGDPFNYIKTQCFAFPALGTLGNLGRNTLRGPGLQNFDFSVFKNHNLLSERLRVQFRAEFFNLFNRTNFGIGLTSIFDAQGRVIPTAGQLRPPTVTTSRQIQFGMRFAW